MKEVNSLPVYEGTDKCALDEYSEKMAEKIPKIIENNKYNDADIKKDISEIKSDISDLQDSQSDQDEYLKDIYNVLPTETAEGENINIKGTANIKFKEFKVSGNSKQETRSGKNLLPYPYNSVQNFIIQDLGDGRIILNGTQETNTSITIKTFNLKAGTYKFLFNTAALPNNSYFFVRNQSTSEILKTNIKTNTTFSLEEDTLTRLDLVLVAGSYSDYKLDLMILEATEEDESFEQYGAMPSPEYPSEIQNVEGNIDITVCNKNLFNSKKIPNGSIITVNDDYSITLKNNTNASGYVNTGIKLKDICKGLKSGNTTFLKIITTFENKYIYLAGINQLWNDEKSKILTEEMLESTVVLYGGYTKTDTVKIQISLNKLEEYTQHQSQTITFPLTEGQKLMQGDYLADDGIHHVRKQIELDGTESWFLSGINYYTSIPEKKLRYELTKGKMLCTHFEETQGSAEATTEVGEFFEAFYSTGNRNVMFNYDNGEVGVDNFKSYLSQQKQAGTPVIVEYELAEEEIEAYTPEQQEAYNQLKQLTAYEEETNIYSTNSTSPIFKVTAVKDINSVITQLNSVLLERS